VILTMHGLSTMHCNLVTDIRVAKETGYEALEIVADKLLRYLDQGYAAEELNPTFRSNSIHPVVINALHFVDRVDPVERKQLLSEAERLCAAAEVICCQTIQLTFSQRLEGRPWPEIRKLVGRNIADVADIGKRHGVRFQLEPIAFAPVHSLWQSLELVEEAGRDNVAAVIDFWHLQAGGETHPDDVAKLDRSMIYSVHFCDGMLHQEGTDWDELALRGYMPGEGELSVQEWVEAVLATGFDGVWSCELASPRHWEWDLWKVARECRRCMELFLPGFPR